MPVFWYIIRHACCGWIKYGPRCKIWALSRSEFKVCNMILKWIFLHTDMTHLSHVTQQKHDRQTQKAAVWERYQSRFKTLMERKGVEKVMESWTLFDTPLKALLCLFACFCHAFCFGSVLSSNWHTWKLDLYKSTLPLSAISNLHLSITVLRLQLRPADIRKGKSPPAD